MKTSSSFLLALAAALLTGLSALADTNTYLSPVALAATRDGQTLFIGCATGKRVLRFSLPERKVLAAIPIDERVSGLALSPGEDRLYVTTGGAEGRVIILNPGNGAILATIPVGHTPCAPVLSRDGATLFVCNQFNNDVSVVDLVAKKEVRRLPASRQPVSAALTPDGKMLLVANLLPDGPADQDYVAAVVSVLDVATGQTVKELRLPSGAGSVQDLRVSPDGKYAVTPHLLARFHLPASQVDRGWMNANALTVIELASMSVLNTVLLDDPDEGAANPWSVAWSADGSKLVVAHAGTHELSVIDWAALLKKLALVAGAHGAGEAVAQVSSPAGAAYGAADSPAEAVAHDLSFLTGLRKRIQLGPEGLGPRSLVMAGSTACAAGYFSDSLCLVEVSAGPPRVSSVRLQPQVAPDAIRQGELYFHDARICFQGWQTCASCHPAQGRVDGFNWDLLNDGVGNPKNSKSMLLAHRTPPAMSLATRDTAEVAVRSGIKFVLFTRQPEAVPAAIDDYLKSLRPVPSPFLVKGKLSDKARRGEKIFHRAGCASCHPPGLFTDLQSYEVGTKGKFDRVGDLFDTPTLIEVWRTAPYLHDGSATTVREVINARNAHDQHGKTSNLSAAEMDELCEYVLSL